MSDKGDVALNEEFRALTLTEFLLARIAEDEAGAQAAARAAGFRWSPDPIPGRVDAPAVDRHYAAHDPARVLAECEAKRRIVEHHEHDGNRCLICNWESVSGSCPTIRHLAAVYADHQDYREEWRP